KTHARSVTWTSGIGKSSASRTSGVSAACVISPRRRCSPTVDARSTSSAERSASIVPGGNGSNRSGKYSPPSGAVPANSASIKGTAGDDRRVLIHFIRLRLERLRPDRHGQALIVHGHEHHHRLCHLDPLAAARRRLQDRPPPLSLNRHADGDRRPAHFHSFRVEADDVAKVDRLVELDFVHRAGDIAVRRRLPRLYRRRQVDVREDHAAEDGAEGVGVLREEQELDGGDALDHRKLSFYPEARPPPSGYRHDYDEPIEHCEVIQYWPLCMIKRR